MEMLKKRKIKVGKFETKFRPSFAITLLVDRYWMKRNARGRGNFCSRATEICTTRVIRAFFRKHRLSSSKLGRQSARKVEL